MSSRNGWKMTDDLSIVIQRNYRDLVRTSSEMKSRQAVLAALTRLSMPMAASIPRHAFRPILYPLHRSCPAIYLVFQTSYVITLARTWAERGRSQPPWISGVLIDVSVRAFPVWSATAREDQSRCGGRKDFVEHRLRLWNFVEIYIYKYFEFKLVGLLGDVVKISLVLSMIFFSFFYYYHLSKEY